MPPSSAALNPEVSPEWDLRSRSFAGALLDPDVEIPLGVGKQNAPAPKRFSVYRNNVVVSLMEAMESVYPSILELLGQENFDRFSRAFIAKHPPTSPMMQYYGREFADFLEQIPALIEAPFLADVARLERQWLDAYHAPDAATLKPEQLSSFSPEDTLTITFKKHPACTLLRSPYPVFDFFNTRHEWPEEEIDLDQAQAVLVSRPEYTVVLAYLSPAQATFFDILLNGKTLGEAIGSAMETAADFNPSETIALAFETGAFSGLG